MKKLLVLFAMIIATTSMIAQEAQKGNKAPKGNSKKQTVEQRAQNSVDRLDKVVMLTTEQKPKIYDLALNRAKKMDEIRGKYKGKEATEDREKAKEEAKAARKEYRDGVKQILTPEQKEKLKEKAKANKARKGKGGKGPKGDKGEKGKKEIKEEKNETQTEVNEDEISEEIPSE